MTDRDKNDILDEIDQDVAAADGMMVFVIVAVAIGGLVVAGVSALIGAL